MTDFGDYIVYVDESGDHGLKTVNPKYPIFCLAFCVFEINDYVNNVVPAFQQLSSITGGMMRLFCMSMRFEINTEKIIESFGMAKRAKGF